MSVDVTKEAGRLALRQEGELWNAYYAMPDTMEGAIFLGSIRITAIGMYPDVKQAFMDAMMLLVGNILSDLHKGGPIKWQEPRPAPESERAGHA